MRVLQVLEATLGGTRRFLEDVFDARSAEGGVNGIAFATERADSGFYNLLDRMRGAGWRLYHLNLGREVDVRRDMACVANLRQVYRDFRPDAIHLHSSKAGAVGRLAALLTSGKIPVIYSPHAIAAHIGAHYVAIEKLLAFRTDIFAAVSEGERSQLLALRLTTPSRARVIVPSIRADYFCPIERPAARLLLKLDSRPLALGIGRLTAQKNPLGFLEIIARANRLIPELRALWVGDGELRDRMQRRVSELGLGRCVTIVGWQNDVRQYIAACNVFISTSVYESFGYATAEALAMRRPVIASAIAGTRDIVVNNVAETLYSPGDYQAGATALTAIVSNDTYAEQIASRGRDHVLRSFSPALTREGLRNAYTAAVNGVALSYQSPAETFDRFSQRSDVL